jgi:pyruvate/2-oxoglutarate dehydrogenase complex dihydrolipoamide acyltransferase (E2) component
VSDALITIPMPHMGVSVTEGTVVAWHKAVGDSVSTDEPVCDIATDKVDTEILAPADGVIARVIASEGETVAVGDPLAEMTVDAQVASVLSNAASDGVVASPAPHSPTLLPRLGKSTHRPKPLRDASIPLPPPRKSCPVLALMPAAAPARRSHGGLRSRTGSTSPGCAEAACAGASARPTCSLCSRALPPLRRARMVAYRVATTTSPTSSCRPRASGA